MDVRNRVIEVRRLKLRDIQPAENNWRLHPETQRLAFRDITREIGFAGAVLTRLLPDGQVKMLDGHMRRDELPDLEVDALVTDLTEDEARKFLLTYDPISALAEADSAKLDALTFVTSHSPGAAASTSRANRWAAWCTGSRFRPESDADSRRLVIMEIGKGNGGG